MRLIAFSCLFIIINLIAASSALFFADEQQPRKFEVQLNPLCDLSECTNPDDNDSYLNLVYVKATAENDILHFFYSNIDSFTVLIYKTTLNATLRIDWPSLISQDRSKLKDSISFDAGTMNDNNEDNQSAVLDAFGYAFPIIYEFNDVNGTANMSKVPNTMDNWYLHHTADLVWNNFTFNSTGDNVGEFVGYHADEPNGTVRFSIRYQGKSVRDQYLPHLLLNRDSSSIDFVLDTLTPKFNYSKFGLNVVFLTEFNTYPFNRSNIDDEYTPGTFKEFYIESVEQNVNQSAKVHNYFEWKPIFYYFNPKTLENSTITHQYDLKPFHQRAPLGIGLSYFNKDRLFSAMNVSFGLEGDYKDGYYYPQTKFSVWTFSVGMGEPPSELMSNIVKLVITIGFGLPAFVILVGLMVMIVKKFRHSNRSDFRPL